MTFGVVMAGGGGERFWPLSRRNFPKQLLNLTGGDIMLNEALSRMGLSKERLFVVTNVQQAQKVEELCAGKLLKENILKEPCARNTAACIGYAAVYIQKKYADGVMIVTPSDAYIHDTEEFQRVLKIAENAARRDAVVTVGIRPTYPATGYGYIRFAPEEGEVKRVMRFVEKPDRARAEEFLRQGEYLWNSGMFLFRISYLLELYQQHLPDLYQDLMKISEAIDTDREKEVLTEVYPRLMSVSFDYGIMEKAESVLVVEGDFGWSDLGSFEALSVVYPPDGEGNILLGDTTCLNVEDSIVISKKKLVAAIGIKDIIAVETDDALLLCAKDRAQDIKKMVELLRSRGREDVL